MNTRQEALHRFAPFVVLAACAAAVLAVIWIRNDGRVLAGNIGVTQYPNGVAMVQAPYRHDGEREMLSAALDLNGDGRLTDDETVLTGIPVTPRNYWNSNLFFRPGSPLAGTVLVRIEFGDESLQQRVRVTRVRDAVVADRPIAAHPDQSMWEGAGPEDVGLWMQDVPDIPQRAGECAPTAAANALIALAKQHGQDGKLPSDTLTMLDELKADMRWTAIDGVLPDDLVVGANLWSLKKGLPVLTTQVGAQNGTGSLDAVTAALSSGGTAQLRLQFSASDVRGKSVAIGGHTVTVIGVTHSGERTFVEVHDPRSPNGTDIYGVSGGRIDYAYIAGVTTVSWGFTQSWTEPPARP